MIDTLACPGCNRRLLAPIKRTGTVRCPTCHYAWRLSSDECGREPLLAVPDFVVGLPVTFETLDLLLIEDDFDFSFLMRHSLERAGHRVAVCHCADALRIVRGPNRFDLIVLGQPFSSGVHGLVFLQTLRSNGIAKPVIFVTGYYEDELPAQAFRAGALDFVFKDSRLTFLKELPARVSKAVTTFRANHRDKMPCGVNDTLTDQPLNILKDTLADKVLHDGPNAKAGKLTYDEPPKKQEVRDDNERREVVPGWTVEEILANVG